VAYSDQAAVQQQVGGLERLTELLDWDGDGAIDAGVLDVAIAEADALIDSFATKHYTVPFNPVPATIRTTSAQLAVIILRRQRGLAGPHDDLRFEQIAGQDGWLFRLAKGIVTPGGDPLPAKHGTMEPDQATTDAPGDRDVSRCKLGGFW
jgi:phage gp36-like protein